MLRHLLSTLYSLLAGPALTRSVQRNDKAADQLDQAVREVLNQ